MASTNQIVFLVESDFGPFGRALNETELGEAAPTDRERLLQDFIAGVVNGSPLRVFAVDLDAADVSADVANELLRRAHRQGINLSSTALGFCRQHVLDVPAAIDD